MISSDQVAEPRLHHLPTSVGAFAAQAQVCWKSDSMQRQLTIPCETSEHSVQVFSALLSQKLLSLGVAGVEDEPGTIYANFDLSTFAAKLFHPFRGATAIHIRMAQGVGSVIVDYDVRLTELGWAFGAAALLWASGSYARSQTLWSAVFPTVFVAALYAISRAQVRYKIDGLFDEVERKFRSVKVVVSE